MMAKKKEIDLSIVFVAVVMLVAIGLFALVFYSYIKMFGRIPVHDAAVWGQFGDFVGGLTNPILSFLALLVLLQSFRYQLESSRRQLAVSEVEKFENTFFKLAERVEAQAEYLFRNPEKPLPISVLRNDLLAKKTDLDKLPWPAGLEKAREHVDGVLRKDSDRIRNFARKVSQCMHFVDRSNLSKVEKNFYFEYVIDSLQKYEYTVFLAVAFSKSSKTVLVIRKYKLSYALKDHAFCCSHVMKLYRGEPIDGIYPFPSSKKSDNDIRSRDE